MQGVSHPKTSQACPTSFSGKSEQSSFTAYPKMSCDGCLDRGLDPDSDLNYVLRTTNIRVQHFGEVVQGRRGSNWDSRPHFDVTVHVNESGRPG